jgi:hypothetical protein
VPALVDGLLLGVREGGIGALVLFGKEDGLDSAEFTFVIEIAVKVAFTHSNIK